METHLSTDPVIEANINSSSELEKNLTFSFCKIFFKIKQNEFKEERILIMILNKFILFLNSKI